MCSIAFLYNKSASIEERKDRISEMNRLSVHRGPDYSSEKHFGDISLGHNRLSIIDLEERSNQPFKIQHFHLIFNGCIYNYKELKTALQENGYSFRTTSDTEVLLTAYIHWGKNCLEKLNGMWSFVIYDKKKEQVFASRDRFGIKPLYYVKKENFLAISSEVKQLELFVAKKLSNESSYAHLVHGYVDYNHNTLYEGIHMLRPSESLSYDVKSDDFSIEKYYSIADKKNDFSEAKIIETIRSSVSLRKRADVRVGLTLSSGLDSNIIAYHLSENSDTDFHAFTTAFPGWEGDESTLSGKSADFHGFNIHTQVPDWAEMKKNVGKLSRIHDMPLSGFATYASFKLYELISDKGIKVNLNGQGADELFGGYDPYFVRYILYLMKTNPLNGIREFIRGVSLNQYKLFSLFKNGIQSRNKRHKKWIKQDYTEIYSDEINIELPFLGKLGYRAIYGYALSSMLHSVDRNSMYHGVESRVPFLDHRLVEMALNMPDHMKISSGKRKYILRKLYAQKLPPHVLSKYKKQGYSSPQNLYLKSDKDEILSEIHGLQEYLPEWVKRDALLFHLKKGTDYKLLWRVWTWVRWREYRT